MHVSKDVFYEDNNIVLNFVYQVPDVNLKGMFWIVTIGKYWIVGKKVLNNSQGNVVTSGIVASVANIVTEGIMIKEKPIMLSHNSKFSILIMESLFIDFYDSSNEDNLSFLDILVLVVRNSSTPST
jgi:hypothetical protein